MRGVAQVDQLQCAACWVHSPFTWASEVNRRPVCRLASLFNEFAPHALSELGRDLRIELWLLHTGDLDRRMRRCDGASMIRTCSHTSFLVERRRRLRD